MLCSEGLFENSAQEKLKRQTAKLLTVINITSGVNFQPTTSAFF